MNTTRYTDEMKLLAIFAAIAAVIIALMIPYHASAALQMQTPMPAAYYFNGQATPDAGKVATTTPKLTRAEKRARIAELKREIRALKAELKKLTK